ncbi:MAG TPA: hypothetical protein VII06_34380 [Chloroflexota bacterium]|jgi:hypothetical protein
MTSRHWLAIGLALLLVGGLVGAQLWARPAPATVATGSLVLVDNTTLLPLRGDVQIQVVGGSAFEPVEGQRALQVGDRVRTGADGYASIVYFDGSSTALAPETELVLQRFERDPVTGATAIIVQQPIGNTWTQAAASGHPYSGFLLASTAARFFARGSQFTTEVAPEGTMTVTAVDGGVFGRADAGDVDLPVGFTTRVAPGQAPEAPVPAPQAAATLQVSITGPVRALLTDARGRSVGYHPDSEALVSQVPGARLVRNDDGSQVFSVPAPVEGYDLTLRGLGAGQTTVAMGVLHAGEREAPAAVRLEAAATTGDTLASSFAWRDGQVRDVHALAPAPGTPAGSAVLLLRHAPPALALAPTETPVPETAQPEDTPEAEALAAKPPAEPDAADVFSSFDSPPLAPRPAVVAPSVPRPAIVTEPAPVRSAVVREPVVRAPERPTSIPVVQGLAVDDDSPTARPILQPSQTPFVVTATPVPPTPVPPTRVPPTPRPPTPVPPSPLPTVPPPLPTPLPTQPPARQAAPVGRPTVASNRPAIAPTATPYIAPPAAPTTTH